MDKFLSGQADGTRRWRVILTSAALVCVLGVVVSPQVQLDVCGCKNSPATLGNFDTANPATYPPGTTFPSINFMDIPLPPDGVMIFDSINLTERPAWVGYGLTVRFIPNAANTPVTLLVAGNVTMGLRTTISVSGDQGLAWLLEWTRHGRSRRPRRIPRRRWRVSTRELRHVRRRRARPRRRQRRNRQLLRQRTRRGCDLSRGPRSLAADRRFGRRRRRIHRAGAPGVPAAAAVAGAAPCSSRRTAPSRSGVRRRSSPMAAPRATGAPQPAVRAAVAAAAGLCGCWRRRSAGPVTSTREPVVVVTPSPSPAPSGWKR